MKKIELHRFAIGSGKTGRKIKKTVRPVRKLLVDFANITTCHGFRQIVVPNRRYIYGFIWSAVVLGLFGGLSTELIDKLNEYMSHETITDLHEEFTRELEFPAVTLCNVNRLTTVHDEIELARVTALSEAALSHTDKSVNHSRVNDEWWDVAIEAFRQDLKLHGRKVYYLRKEFLEKGWQLNDTTLKHCSFEKKKCSMANFSQYVTPMGLCYTFLTDKDSVQKVPGSSHGLELYINVNEYEYTKNESTNISSGVKILIHHHDESPEVHSYGPTISSGHTGHISIEKTKRHLLEKPWGNCIQEHKDLKHHHYYSVANCMHECKVHFIYEACNCTPFWDVEEGSHECDALEILTCAGKAEADFPLVMTEEMCGCNLPCDFMSYTIDGTSLFPSIEVAEFLLTDAYREKELEHVEDLDQIDAQFRQLQTHGKDHVMIDIFYNKISYVVRSQKKAISEVSLMSDFGGLLGLWLGISLVTLGEFVQLAVDGLEMFIKSRKTRKSNPQMVFEKGLEASKVDSQMFKSLDFNEEDEEEDKDNTNKLTYSYQYNR